MQVVGLALLEQQINQSFSAGEGFSLTLPLPTVKNQIFTTNVSKRTHYQIYKKVRDKYKEEVFRELDKFDTVIFESLNVTYKLYLNSKLANREPDLDNLLTYVKKFFNDCLKEKGFIRDDDVFVLDETKEKFMGVANETKVEIELKHGQAKEVKKWEIEKPKLRSNNSFTIEKETFFVVKKNWEGKPDGFYCVYRYSDGLFITFHKTKEEAIEKTKRGYVDKIREIQQLS